MERTLVFFKPDAFERNIIYEIVNTYIIPMGFRIVSVKPIIVNKEKILEHYNENLKGKSQDIVQRVLKFYINKMILILVLEKDNAICDFRKILGTSDPSKSPNRTIRGDYCDDSYELAEKEKRSCRNIMHASDSYESYIKEFNIWLNN